MKYAVCVQHCVAILHMTYVRNMCKLKCLRLRPSLRAPQPEAQAHSYPPELTRIPLRNESLIQRLQGNRLAAGIQGGLIGREHSSLRAKIAQQNECVATEVRGLTFGPLRGAHLHPPAGSRFWATQP